MLVLQTAPLHGGVKLEAVITFHLSICFAGAPPQDEAGQALHAKPVLVRETSCAPHKLLAAQGSTGDR